MAYRTHAHSNTSLISSLATYNIIASSTVKTAMHAIDRADFVSSPTHAYEDSPQGIGWGATISAPHMHAMAMEWLGGGESLGVFGLGKGKDGDGDDGEGKGKGKGEGSKGDEISSPLRGKRVLDIGSGSGYLSACLAEMVFGPESESETKSETKSSKSKDAEEEENPKSAEISTSIESTDEKSVEGNSKGEEGLVVAIEHIKELRDLGERNVCKSARGRRLVEEGKIQFVVGDGREGWVGDGKGYDAIHVGAAAVSIHEALINQLRSPGRIFIPVQDTIGYNQYIWVIDKDIGGKVSKKRLCGVNYVPLTDAPSSGMF